MACDHDLERMAETLETETSDGGPPVAPAANSDGVDLTQIRALRALSPTERVRRLVPTVRNLERFGAGIRRV